MTDLDITIWTILYGLLGITELYVLITMVSYDCKRWKETNKEKKEKERRQKIENEFKNRKLTD